MKKVDGVELVTDDGVNFTVKEPTNSQWVYKCRAEDGRLVPVGVLTKKNELYRIFPTDYRGMVTTISVSLYEPDFWVELDNARTSINFSKFYSTDKCYIIDNPSNRDDFQEITTQAEDCTYTLGWRWNGTVIFYDQYVQNAE